MSNGISAEYFKQGWQFLNRVYLGQIDQIDTVRGTCSIVIFDGLDTTRDNIELPRLGFSMNGHQSSWIRYMPQFASQVGGSSTDGGGGDMVYVAFGPRNEARIVGFATDVGVYGELVDERANNPANVPAEFSPLEMGEWDLRSSGGAYVLGNRAGQLLLAAGPTVQMRFDKQNNEVRTESGLWKLGGGGSFVKLGDVKRTLLPTDFKETDVSILDPTTTKEFNLHLENFLPVPTAIMDLQMGAVRNGKGVPIPSLNGGLPLRHRHKIYVPEQPSADPELIEVFSDEIDADGNRSTTHLTAENIELTAPTSTVNEVVLNRGIEASGTVDLAAGGAITMTAGGAATLSAAGTVLIESLGLTTVDGQVAVSLGDPVLSAINPSVHGTVLFASLSTLVVALQSLADAKNPPPTFTKDPDYVPLQTALTALSAILALPPGTPASLLSRKVFVE